MKGTYLFSIIIIIGFIGSRMLIHFEIPFPGDLFTEYGDVRETWAFLIASFVNFFLESILMVRSLSQGADKVKWWTWLYWIFTALLVAFFIFAVVIANIFTGPLVNGW